MRAVGVICEYNPFHNGHAYHLKKARELSSADYVICVMSGSVTQRGTFARHDKWTRAQMALQGGADLVLELPVRFAVSSAQEFASGGVGLLDRLGVVSHLSFGCEGEALPLLSAAQEALRSETPEFTAALREGLDQGMSYPRARAQAAAKTCSVEGIETALSLPNAALALEYLAALPEGIAPIPVLREGSGYHDASLSALPSATAVRRALTEDRLDAAKDAVPCPELLAASEARGDVHEEGALSQALLYCLRTMPDEQLSQIAGMDEGLHHRFIAAAHRCTSRRRLIEAVKTKRYTWARLSRLCSCALLGITRDFAGQNSVPTYARILGLRRDAAPLLREIKQRSSIPLITKAADYDKNDPLYALDLRAQDLWSLGCTAKELRTAGRDLITPPVII